MLKKTVDFSLSAGKKVFKYEVIKNSKIKKDRKFKEQTENSKHDDVNNFTMEFTDIYL